MRLASVSPGAEERHVDRPAGADHLRDRDRLADRAAEAEDHRGGDPGPRRGQDDARAPSPSASRRARARPPRARSGRSRKSSRQMLATIGTTMIARIRPAMKMPLDCGVAAEERDEAERVVQPRLEVVGRRTGRARGSPRARARRSGWRRASRRARRSRRGPRAGRARSGRARSRSRAAPRSASAMQRRDGRAVETRQRAVDVVGRVPRPCPSGRRGRTCRRRGATRRRPSGDRDHHADRDQRRERGQARAARGRRASRAATAVTQRSTGGDRAHRRPPNRQTRCSGG